MKGIKKCEWQKCVYWLLIFSVSLVPVPFYERIEATERIEAPRLEYYDLESGGRVDLLLQNPNNDESELIAYSEYILNVPDTTGGEIVRIIKDHKGKEARHLTVYNQTYLIQASNKRMIGGVEFNEVYAIKEGHIGDGVFYASKKYWNDNTGFIFLDKIGTKNAEIKMDNGNIMLLEGTGTWDYYLMPISEGAKTKILEDGKVSEIYTFGTYDNNKVKDNNKGLISNYYWVPIAILFFIAITVLFRIILKPKNAKDKE